MMNVKDSHQQQYIRHSSAGFQRIAAVAEVLNIRIQETHILLKS